MVLVPQFYDPFLRDLREIAGPFHPVHLFAVVLGLVTGAVAMRTFAAEMYWMRQVARAARLSREVDFILGRRSRARGCSPGRAGTGGPCRMGRGRPEP